MTTTKEIPEIYKRWIEALRSGKYKQGTGYLKDSDDKYCCLGVLCDIEDVKFTQGWDELPPREFTNTLGWGGDNGYIFYPNNENKVSFPTLNDKLGLSFDQIADLIEKYWDTIE